MPRAGGSLALPAANTREDEMGMKREPGGAMPAERSVGTWEAARVCPGKGMLVKVHRAQERCVSTAEGLARERCWCRRKWAHG